MKSAVLIPFLLALSSPLWAEDKKEPPPEYGERGAQTLTIRVDGEVERPGIYHVRAGITFSEFIEQAGQSRLSNGRYKVSRDVKGTEESIYVRYDRDKKVFVPNPELLDGDFVYAAFYMAFKEPIQPPEPTRAAVPGSDASPAIAVSTSSARAAHL